MGMHDLSCREAAGYAVSPALLHLGIVPGAAEPTRIAIAVVCAGLIAGILPGDREAGTEDCGTWARGLVARLAIPSLRHYGIREEHLPGLAEKAARASSMKTNPIVLTREELIPVLANSM